MLHTPTTATERIFGALLIPLLLLVSVWGRACLCGHEVVAESGGCCEQTAQTDRGATPADPVGLHDQDESCCCVESDVSNPATFLELPAQPGFDGQARMIAIQLATPALGALPLIDEDRRLQKWRLGALPVRLPEQAPRYLLFESFLC